MNKVFLWFVFGVLASGLSACKTSSKSPVSVNFEDSENFIERTRVIYDPEVVNAIGLPQIPLITDLLLQGFAGVDLDCNSQGKCLDGTIPFPDGDASFFTASGDINEDYNPIFSAVSDLDGFSTSASIDISFDGPIDETSIITTGNNSNVMLIPLNHVNDPVTGGGIGSDDLPQLSSEPYGSAVPILVSTLAYTGESQANNTTLRITPLEPLQPATQYLIIITDGLKDDSGIGVAASATFNFAASLQGEIADPDLLGLRNAIQKWVALSLQYTNSKLGGNNTQSNIAYTTTFTTAGTHDVLLGMAAPSVFFNDNNLKQILPKNARYHVEKGILSNQSNNEIQEVICRLDGMDCSDTSQILNQIKLARYLPQPAPRVASFARQARLPEDSGVRIYDGMIKLPYYLSSPTGMDDALSDSTELEATGARAITSIWRADDSLVKDFDGTDISVNRLSPPSENVTRHYPLAKTGEHSNDSNKGYIEAPISVFIDHRATLSTLSTDRFCPDGFTPIIYQHGIFGNRRDAAVLAGQFADRAGSRPACEAVIAIDLPLHGLDGEDQDLLYRLYTPSETGIFSIPTGIFDQRHYGLYQDESGFPGAMLLSVLPTEVFPEWRFNIAENASGSLFINLINFQGTRDNIRQAVMDSLNLNASLPFLDFNEFISGPDLNMDVGIRYAGHSLGGIIGTNTISVTKLVADENPYLHDFDVAVLANVGGNLAKLLENSFNLSEIFLGTFKALGETAGLDLEEGSRLLELTIHFLQATLDSADPVNFSKNLAEEDDTGLLIYAMVGDGTENNPPDLTIPPSAYEALGHAPRVILDDLLVAKDTSNNDKEDTAIAPLVGSIPLASLMQLNPTSKSINATDGKKLKLLVKFLHGNHQSFLDSGTHHDSATFDELMQQTMSFFDSAGESLSINNSEIIIQ